MITCSKCHRDAGVGFVIEGKNYCQKCGEVKLGLRDKNGKEKEA